MPPLDLSVNTAGATVMHIDLNSCFATIEAQSNRLLRGRPVGVAAYDTPRGFVLAANYVAKAQGVKLGVNVAQARAMCPGIVIMTPDPSKYREAHKRFKDILLRYTSDVVPKSIDEFVLNLDGSPSQRSGQSMEDIGRQIKQDISRHLGEAVTVNVGIGPNRFLAKYAAGFDKPDGMTRIDHSNLLERYAGMDLVDLPGINLRYRARLWAAGIYTPLDFLAADVTKLQKIVFRSINGYYWYLRLRGYEIDNYQTSMRSVGHQYALPKKTADRDELKRLIMKLSEKIGRRLRQHDVYATGIHLYLGFEASDYQMTTDFAAGFENMHRMRSWHHGEKLGTRLYATSDIYHAACRLLAMAEINNRVKLLALTTFDLAPYDPEQLSLFQLNPSGVQRQEDPQYRYQESARRLAKAVDALNDRYGEFVVTPAMMMDMHGEILDRIAFGNTPA